MSFCSEKSDHDQILFLEEEERWRGLRDLTISPNTPTFFYEAYFPDFKIDRGSSETVVLKTPGTGYHPKFESA